MKTLLAITIAIMAISCSNPVSTVQPEVAAQSDTVQQSQSVRVITGTIDGSTIRWGFRADYGQMQVQLNGRGPWVEFYEYDVGAVLLWYYEGNSVIVDDPTNYFTGSNYRLMLVGSE
jgi:hypothetical protein